MERSAAQSDAHQITDMTIPTLSTPSHWQMLEAIFRPIAYYRRCFLHNTGVVRVKMSPRLPPQQILVSDPTVIKQLMDQDGGGNVTAPGELNGLLSQVLGENSIILLAPEQHRRRRRLLTPPFHGERLKAYGRLILDLTHQTFADLNIGDVFDAREQMQRITMRVILTAVFGLHEGDAFRSLERWLTTSLSIRSGPLGSLLLFFPLLRRDLGNWSPGGRIKTADAAVRRLLLTQIAFRRGALEQNREQKMSADILSLLLSSRDDEGQGLSDDELHDELLTLLFAGHETTATVLTWALYWIHRNPLVLERLLNELNALTDHSNPDAIARLPYLSAVINEVLRIHPVAMLTFPRRIETPITLGSHGFSSGDVVLACIQALHERSDLYPKPFEFDPDRFIRRNYSNHEFMPFGGGSRRCIGASLALYEMKLILAHLLQQNRFQLIRRSNRMNQPRRRGFTLGPSIPVKLKIVSSQ